MEKTFDEMTVVEKFAAVAEILPDGEVRDWILTRKEMAGRKSTSKSKANPEVAARKAAVAQFLAEADEPVLAKQVAEALGMSDGQARSALTALVKEETAVATIPGKGKARLYAIA